MKTFYLLLINQFKESKRSILWHRNLATNIFFGILLILIGMQLLSFGLLINNIFDALYPDQDHTHIFNSWLLYYFMFDMILRYFLQKDPGLSIKPYLYLPVSRSKLIHFLLVRSATSLLNLLPLLLIFPFVFKVVIPQYGVQSGITWLLAVVFLIFCNSYLSFYIRRRISRTPMVVWIFILALAVILLFDYFEIFSIRYYSGILFSLFIIQGLWLIFPVLGLILIYQFNFLLFKDNLYQDTLLAVKKSTFAVKEKFSYLEYFGETGEYLSLELKMILRNKRTKSSFVMALMMLVIGPFFYLSMSEIWEPYPQPDPYMETLIESDTQITFKIYADSIPGNATVFISGDHERLGRWARGYGFIPMEQQADGSWQRLISFPKGTPLQFKFTLGLWKNQRINPDGSIPDPYRYIVNNDTALIFHASHWRVPPRFIFVDIMIIYMGLIFVGILMLIYGQFMLAWESGYFDFILARRINYQRYFLAKYILLLILGAAMFMITVPVILIARELLVINGILTIYSMGVNSIIMFIMAGYTRKKLDLNASIFSTQGKGVNQFTLIIPTLIIPILLFLPFALTEKAMMGYIFLLMLGILGLVFHRPLLSMCLRLFYNQKYRISAGFKQSRG